MPKRKREEVMRDILEALKDGQPHAYGDLERKADTNWQTVRDHCKELVLFEAATITDEGVQITPRGRQVLERINATKKR